MRIRRVMRRRLTLKWRVPGEIRYAIGDYDIPDLGDDVPEHLRHFLPFRARNLETVLSTRTKLSGAL